MEEFMGSSGDWIAQSLCNRKQVASYLLQSQRFNVRAKRPTELLTRISNVDDWAVRQSYQRRASSARNSSKTSRE